MARFRRETALRWAIIVLALGILGCHVALNAPRPVLVAPNVHAVAARPPAAVLTVVPGPRMPHAKHANLACDDCHEPDEVGGFKAPALAFCLECHADMQEEENVPPERRIESLFFDAQQRPKWRKAVQSYDPDVIFSHAPHRAANVECKSCHGDMAEVQRLGRELLTMAQCSACHVQRGAANGCAACHRQTRKEVAPPDHRMEWELRHGASVRAAEARGLDTSCHYCHGGPDFCNACHQGRQPSSHAFDWERRHGPVIWQAGGPEEARCTYCHRDPTYCDACHQNRKPASHDHLWTRRHGALARAGDVSGMTRCTFCHHQPAFCEDCHQVEEPNDHTALFRTRTHGIVAQIDRTRCMVCHETDFCVRCHEETSPRSHRGQWARGLTTHCIYCHFPIAAAPQCVVCHKDNPTHDTATSLPPNHNPASNCRACHNTGGGGAGPRIPHLDPGIPCQVCHN